MNVDYCHQQCELLALIGAHLQGEGVHLHRFRPYRGRQKAGATSYEVRLGGHHLTITRAKDDWLFGAIIDCPLKATKVRIFTFVEKITGSGADTWYDASDPDFLNIVTAKVKALLRL